MKRFILTLKLIWQGWSNYFIDLVSDIKYKRYFEERYNICMKCEFNKLSICQKCGCVLKAKTKAEDAECPIGKWKTIYETLNINRDEGKN